MRLRASRAGAEPAHDAALEDRTLAAQHHTTGLLRGRRASWLGLVALAIVLLPLLAACGGGGDSGDTDISWQPGLPTQTVTAPPASGEVATTAPEQPTTESTAAPTPPAETPTTAATTPPESGPTGRSLTPEELAQYKPNELGKILVLEYHRFTADPAKEEQFVRPFSKFRDDLQWLYDNNFYVVSMKSVIEDNIAAPAGKKPVVLTFDDSSYYQFGYIVNQDGSTTLDPNSAVGIMQEFYAAHPDFGRGGLFGVLPNACFDWDDVNAFPDQSALCGQKITFLLDNGYEVGNHTYDHTNIYDVDDETFKSEIAKAIIALQEYDPRVEANIFVVPNGMYPDRDKHPDQREWMKNGFSWDGKDYLLIGSLMVGSQPQDSPVSTEWDSMWIYRIQMCDCGAGGQGWDDTWKQYVEDSPGILYVSDGDPNTITIPNALTPELDGVFNESSVGDKEVIRY